MTQDAANSAPAADESRFFALIPCAGSGSRAGTAGPKQYQRLLGQALVQHTLDAFRAVRPPLAGVGVVVAPDDTAFTGACPDFGLVSDEVLLPTGGASRAASVLNGLRALLAGAFSNSRAVARPQDWVLVHDAARCLVTPDQITALIAACRDDAVGGLLAQRLPDTLKSGERGRVNATVDRHDKWLAQTPQMFRIGPLVDALAEALANAGNGGQAVTDESSAMEAAGFAPLLVAGSAQNFKVTYPEDFALAEAVLASRSAAVAASGVDAPALRPTLEVCP